MLTIVFYSTNGNAAKIRSREIVALNRGDYARCYDASVWDGSKDKCDLVEIMPDVNKWQRNRIKQVFGEIAVDYEEVVNEQMFEEEEPPHRKSLGLMPEKDPEPNVKKAVHKGGGRWFVMIGEERVSGPHDKAEAMRLAAEGDDVAA